MAELQAALGLGRAEFELTPGGGGVFDVVVDGERVFSKHEQGRFPQYREIVGLVEARILRT